MSITDNIKANWPVYLGGGVILWYFLRNRGSYVSGPSSVLSNPTGSGTNSDPTLALGLASLQSRSDTAKYLAGENTKVEQIHANASIANTNEIVSAEKARINAPVNALIVKEGFSLFEMIAKGVMPNLFNKDNTNVPGSDKTGNDQFAYVVSGPLEVPYGKTLDDVLQFGISGPLNSGDWNFTSQPNLDNFSAPSELVSEPVTVEPSDFGGQLV